ncbi:MAG: AI-2E family transporter [Gammaproteobacteria bacterium WSBS_2016_MAG_OTU1]
MKTIHLLFVAIAGAVLWVLHAAGAALAPFALAGVLAYILSPLAGKLETKVSPATVASILVAMIFLVLLLLPLAIAPIIAEQTSKLLSVLPTLVERTGNWLGDAYPYIIEQLQAMELSDWSKHATSAIDGQNTAAAAKHFLGFFGAGISAIIGFFTFLLLTPLAAFYFLRDRDTIAGVLADSLPPRWRDETMTVLHDLDGVLGEFFHGQLSVMVIMAILYSLILWIAGLDFALTIGIITGLLVFIPYFGFIIGIVLVTIVALGQFEAWGDFILLWVLMVGGTVVESMFITPWLVGERIGLHPVFVLLALFVMGSLLGFVGVLTALPLAAVLLVLSRHLRRRYINSDFYGRSS